MDNQAPQQPIPSMPTNDPVNAPPAMPPTAPPAAPQHTHTLLFTAIIAGIIILFITVILFAVFLSSNRNTVSSKTFPTPIPTTEDEIIPSATVLPPTTTKSTTIDTSTWKMYTDTSGFFTYQYPITWTVKQGFDFENDIIVYDPQSMKNRPTFNEKTRQWPDHFVNVVSVEASSTTAKQYTDEYITSWNKTNKEANRMSFIKNGVQYEFYDVLGETSFNYRNAAISNGNVLILLTTSANTLEDKTIESSIIQSLMLTK